MSSIKTLVSRVLDLKWGKGTKCLQYCKVTAKVGIFITLIGVFLTTPFLDV